MCIVNVGDTSEIGNLVEEFSSCVYEGEVDEISEDESVKLKYFEVLLTDVDVLVEAKRVMEGVEPFAVWDDSMFEEVLFWRGPRLLALDDPVGFILNGVEPLPRGKLEEEAKGPTLGIPSPACVTVDLTWVEELFLNAGEGDCWIVEEGNVKETEGALFISFVEDFVMGDSVSEEYIDE